MLLSQAQIVDGAVMKEEQERIQSEECNDVRSRNYLKRELRIVKLRWLILVFLFLFVNLFGPPNLNTSLCNIVMALGAAYNIAFFLYYDRKRSYSVKLAFLSLYLDSFAVAFALYYTGGIDSPFLFIWYLILFAAGVRFGYAVSFWIQLPVGLAYAFLLYHANQLPGQEALSRLLLGLFSFTVSALFGALFSREEQDVMDVMAGLRKESITDRLTGLFNYSYFMDELQREQARAERTKSHFSLVIFDLDLFKQVNDTYGHEKGNVLLQEVAAIIKANARMMDTVARYGGEEFVILMPESNGSEIDVAERIRKKIEEADFAGIADRPIKITISGGVCTYPRDAESVNELLDKADKGLYAAKTCGRNRTSYCEPMGRK